MQEIDTQGIHYAVKFVLGLAGIFILIMSFRHRKDKVNHPMFEDLKRKD